MSFAKNEFIAKNKFIAKNEFIVKLSELSSVHSHIHRWLIPV